jgi:hypothetical protein
MNNLVKLSSTPAFNYDWSLIEDFSDRSVAQTAVAEYAKRHKALREKAEEIIKEDNLAKAQCVYKLKLSLKHGQFYEVCEQALGLNYQTASALATSGKLLTESSHKDDVLRLFKVMEPRAGKQFLLMDEQAKHDHVVRFEETGRIPSRNDFTNRTKDDALPKMPAVTPSPKQTSDTRFDQITQVLKASRISVPELLEWMATAFEAKQPSDDTRHLVLCLYAQVAGAGK